MNVMANPSIATKQGRLLVIEARDKINGREPLINAIRASLTPEMRMKFSSQAAMILIRQIIDGPSDREVASNKVIRPIRDGTATVELLALAGYLKVAPIFLVTPNQATQNDELLRVPDVIAAPQSVEPSVAKDVNIQPTPDQERSATTAPPVRFLKARLSF